MSRPRSRQLGGDRVVPVMRQGEPTVRLAEVVALAEEYVMIHGYLEATLDGTIVNRYVSE